MNRRKFFGFGAGAAIAGSAVTQDVTSKMVEAKGVPYIHHPYDRSTDSYFVDGANSIDPKHYVEQDIRSTINKINHLNNKYEQDIERINYQRIHITRGNVENLRSVSKQFKIYMISDRERAINKENELFNLERRLEHLKKEFFSTFKTPFVE
jgi:hypothetical protein